MIKTTTCLRWAVMSLAVAGLAACAQLNTKMVGVKNPGSFQQCSAGAVCEVTVAMTLAAGKCEYDVPETLFVPKGVSDIQWVIKPASGEPSFRFVKGVPVKRKANDKGPDFSGSPLSSPARAFAAKRANSAAVGVTSYQIEVEYMLKEGGPAVACDVLDPLIVGMP